MVSALNLSDRKRPAVELANIRPGQRILEPSAATGSLLNATADSGIFTSPNQAAKLKELRPFSTPDVADAVNAIVAADINQHLAEALQQRFVG